jgi:hypothetical protein
LLGAVNMEPLKICLVLLYAKQLCSNILVVNKNENSEFRLKK